MTSDGELERRLRDALGAVADTVTDHVDAAADPPPPRPKFEALSFPRSSANHDVAPRHPTRRTGAPGARRGWALPVSVAAVVAVIAATVGLLLAGSGSNDAPTPPGAPGSSAPTGSQFVPSGPTVQLPGSTAGSTATTSVPASVPASSPTGP